MRVNVYAAEITDRLEIIKVIAKNTGSIFIGIRFYFESPDVLKPPAHPDDDSSGVTFWVNSKKSGYRKGNEERLAQLFTDAATALRKYNG